MSASTSKLARSKSLRKLHLFSTELADPGLAPLGTVPQLMELDLEGSYRISTQAKTAFIKARPNVSVR